MPAAFGRHTETNDNRARIYTGQRNIPLNSTGRGQAYRLAKRMSLLPNVVAIFSSDLSRAAYLAHAIGRLIGIKPVLTTDLREVGLGEIERENLTSAQIAQRYPGSRHQTRYHNFDFTDIGGESKNQALARARRAMSQVDAVFRRYDPRTAHVVIISHGTLLRVLLQSYGVLDGELHEQGDYQIFPWPLGS